MGSVIKIPTPPKNERPEPENHFFEKEIIWTIHLHFQGFPPLVSGGVTTTIPR